jgi:hypothetical protein
MEVGEEHAVEVWNDISGWCKDNITISEDGFGDLPQASAWMRNAVKDKVGLDYVVFKLECSMSSVGSIVHQYST